MDQATLVTEQIKAGEEFVHDFDHALPVDVAFWLKPAEADGWYLYLASPDIDDGNKHEAYGEVVRRGWGRRSPWFDPLRVKLLNSSDPLAVKTREMRDRFPVKAAMRFGDTTIDGLAIDDAYIYPPLPCATAAP